MQWPLGMTLILRPVVSFCQCSNVCINKVHKKMVFKNKLFLFSAISRLVFKLFYFYVCSLCVVLSFVGLT